MDEQNNKAPIELQDEQVEDISGGAFTGTTAMYGGLAHWKCSHPKATINNATVCIHGVNVVRKKCPYSTTPLKMCAYVEGLKRFACKYYSSYRAE